MVEAKRASGNSCWSPRVNRCAPFHDEATIEALPKLGNCERRDLYDPNSVLGDHTFHLSEEAIGC